MTAKGGKIRLCGGELRVRFPWSKERFDVVRKVRDAKYDKEAKEWRIPIALAPILLRSKLFDPAAISYEFTRDDFDTEYGKCEAGIGEARAALAANPFSVSEEHLSKLDLDVIFRFAPSGHAVHAAPKFRSRAKKLLKEMPGVQYTRKERSFIFPAHLLHDFVKRLRDKKLTFGIEELLGKRLSETGALRAQIAAGKYRANADELRECLLVPYVETHNGSFRLCAWSTEQLSVCFPGLKQFSEKKARAMSMSEEQLLDLLHRTAQSGLRVWQVRDVEEGLQGFRKRLSAKISVKDEAVEDSELFMLKPEIAFVRWKDGEGAVYLGPGVFESEVSEKEKEVLKRGTCLKGVAEEGDTLICIRDSKLLTVYELLKAAFETRRKKALESRSFQELLEDLKRRAALLKEREAFQKMRNVTDILGDSGLETRLYPHQRVAVKWILERPAGILGDDMGLGKTLSVLAAFGELKRRGECDFLLVACPNSLVRNWIREAWQWTQNIHLHYLPSAKRDREAFLKNIEKGSAELDGLVLNYETLRLESVCPKIQAICRRHKVFLCIDESQRVKNPRSITFKALNSVAALCGRRVLLSGTPVPKDISDIWAQMRIADGGERFGTRFYDWLQSVAELGNKWSDFAVKRFIPEAVEETILRVQEVLLRRKKEDVVSLPPKIFNYRDIELGGEQKKRYEEVCEELLLRVTSVEGDSFYKSIESILEEYLRAVQIASNPRLVDPEWKGDPAKFVELDEIVREIVEERGEKIVVWTNYRKNIEELVARYAHLGTAAFSGDVPVKERAEIISRFQDAMDRSLQVLVAIPAAGGVGITLTAAQTAVYVDRTWNAEHWLQSIDRIHRIGQQATVNIVVLNASKVDELIGFNLRRKEKNQERLLSGAVSTDSALYPGREELLGALKK